MGVIGRAVTVFSKDAVFLTCWVVGVTVGGVECREVAVVVVGVTTGGVVTNSFGRTAGGGGGRIPLPLPDAPVGTNSLAKGLGWNPGLSFLVVVGDEVPDSGRDDGASREEVVDMVGGYWYIT